MTLASKSSTWLSPEACLFVANLPSRYSNEQLSYRLLSAFKAFGPIASIKTSRDHAGRPFGFIQFENQDDAIEVLRRKYAIHMAGRRIRVEKARCLRKLQISVSLLSSMSLQEIKSYLMQYSHEQDIIRLDIDPSNEQLEDRDVKPKFSFIIQLRDDLIADNVIKDLETKFPEWHLEWVAPITKPRSIYDLANWSGNIVYFEIQNEQNNYPSNYLPFGNSSRQQIDKQVKEMDGNYETNEYVSPLPMASEEDSLVGSLNDLVISSSTQEEPNNKEDPTKHSRGNLEYNNADVTRDPQPRPGVANYPHIHITSHSHSASHPLQYSPAHSHYGDLQPSYSSNYHGGRIGTQIFIGRLNPQKVDEEMVHERFSEYGDIHHIQVVNKNHRMNGYNSTSGIGLAGGGGIPQDAFAFVTYKKAESAERAIINEHGRTWMGQAIKVTYALTKPPPAAFLPDGTFSQVPSSHVGHPPPYSYEYGNGMYIPPIYYPRLSHRTAHPQQGIHQQTYYYEPFSSAANINNGSHSIPSTLLQNQLQQQHRHPSSDQFQYAQPTKSSFSSLSNGKHDNHEEKNSFQGSSQNDISHGLLSGPSNSCNSFQHGISNSVSRNTSTPLGSSSPATERSKAMAI